MIEIFVNNQKLDLYQDTDIKFTFQVNDIADIKYRQANYTNSFNIPKTANNVRVFEGLGIPSNTSKIPYEKSDCRLKMQGFDLIIKGWINITDTTETEYKIHIYSGVIIFFKAIENRTLDEVVGNDFEHRKNTANVINSLNSNKYRYLITDYNGLTHFNKNGRNVVNIDYLVPSFSVKYVWDKLHSFIGFEYEGDVFNTEDFNNLWITYPKYIDLGNYQSVVTGRGVGSSMGRQREGVVSIGYGTDTYLIIKDTKVYRFKIDISYPPDHYPLNANQITNHIYLRVYRDGKIYTERYIAPISNTGNTFYINELLEVGDEVYIIQKSTQDSNGSFTFILNIEVTKTDNFVNFSNELKDFAVKDFIKEITNRFGLTIITDEHSNKVKYLTLKERIQKSEKIDWSEKYIERNNEKYISGFYAQKNHFKNQYNDKENNYNDAILGVDNKNITENKILFQSKLYSSERDYLDFYLSDNAIKKLKTFKFYEKEVDEKKGIKYKGLDKRFYILKSERINTFGYIGSNELNELDRFNSLNIAVENNISWQYYLGRYYSDFGKIINSFKIHQIELNLSLADILNLDFNKLYYFKQEQKYYLLNKLTSSNDKYTAEFVPVVISESKSTETIIETPPIIEIVTPTFEIEFADGTQADKIQTENNVRLKLQKFNNDNQPVLRYWQKKDRHGNYVNITPYSSEIQEVSVDELGYNYYRLRVVLRNGQDVYSNELKVIKAPYISDTLREFIYYIDQNAGAYFLFINREKKLQELKIEKIQQPIYGSSPYEEIRFLAYSVIIANY